MAVAGLSPPPLWLCISLLVVFLTYIYWKNTYGYWRKHGIPGPIPLPFIGNSIDYFTKDLKKMHDDDLKKYGKVVGGYFGHMKTLLVADRDVAYDILVKNFKSFTHKTNPEVDDDFGGKMLFTLNGDEWKKSRKQWSPAFSTRCLRGVTPQLVKCADDLTRNIDEAIKRSADVEITQFAGTFSLDTVANIGFGVTLDSRKDPNHPFVKTAFQAFKGNPLFSLAFFMPWLFNFMKRLGLFDVRMIPKVVINTFSQLIRPLMDKRIAEIQNEGKTDFLQIMLKGLSKPVVGENVNMIRRNGFTKDEVIIQTVLFLIGGFETTKSAISQLLYWLSLNPQCQDRICDEIQRVMGNRTVIDYDVVKQMTYLDMALDESMRIHSPFLVSLRLSNEDVVIRGIPIAKNTQVNIALYALAEDPDVWGDPHVFRPERFTHEQKAKRHPCQFMPFSLGPRNCVAMRLALYQIKIAAVMLIRKFRFTPCQKTEIPLKLSGDTFRHPLNGIHLKVQSRD